MLGNSGSARLFNSFDTVKLQLILNRPYCVAAVGKIRLSAEVSHYMLDHYILWVFIKKNYYSNPLSDFSLDTVSCRLFKENVHPEKP